MLSQKLIALKKVKKQWAAMEDSREMVGRACGGHEA